LKLILAAGHSGGYLPLPLSLLNLNVVLKEAQAALFSASSSL